MHKVWNLQHVAQINLEYLPYHHRTHNIKYKDLLEANMLTIWRQVDKANIITSSKKNMTKQRSSVSFHEKSLKLQYIHIVTGIKVAKTMYHLKC